MAVVGWLALRPLPVPWVEPTNLQPLATIRSELDTGTLDALYGLARGLARLAALGVLLPLASWRPERTLAAVCARTVGAGALISSAILLLQSGVPGRSVNVDTVLLDSAGVALACLLVFPVVRALLRRGPGDGTRWGGPRWDGSAHGSGAHDVLHLRDETAGGVPPRAARVGIAP
nr:VanZ family protein [Streptomyces sp. HNM0575]